MKTSPTQRTLAALRKDGYFAEVVERWNAYARVRQDLFGGIDIIAIRPGECVGVQCTSASNLAARITKLKSEPKIRAWLEAGNSLQCWGWSKKGPRGKRKLWTPTVTDVTLADHFC